MSVKRDLVETFVKHVSFFCINLLSFGLCPKLFSFVITTLLISLKKEIQDIFSNNRSRVSCSTNEK